MSSAHASSSSMSAAHAPLPPLYQESAYASHADQKAPMSAGSQQSLPGPPMGSGSVSTAPVIPEPPVLVGTRGNYEFALVIDQQPIRARMCGFGDKDRRPITPPPCIRVIVTNLTTGQEVPAEEIDSTFFLLSVDLWDEAASQEKNIVRSSSNSPSVSISTATTTSFPVPPERTLYASAPPGVQMYQQQYNGAPYHNAQGPVYTQPQPQPAMYSNPPTNYYPPGPGYPQYAQPPPGSPAYPQQQFPQPQAPVPYTPPAQAQSSGMFTRNLIGSLAVNAFTLNDLDGKKGHWFILQDLSVRTEGNFRLKMSFIDLGTHQDQLGKGDNKLNCGKTNVLASVFSQSFQVFSAKKFPGVIESTPLSKSFASQGIKIPIRKDGMKGEVKDEDAAVEE